MRWASPPRRTGFRLTVTLAIVGIWLILMAILVKDRYFPSVSTIPDALKIARVEADDWFVVRIKGAYSGFGRSRQFKKGEHWALRDELNLSLNVQGRAKPVRIVNESTVDSDFRLVSFALKVTSGIISFEQAGRVEGGELVLKMPASQGGGVKRLKLYETPRISRSLGLPMPLIDLKVGQEFRIPIVDPLDGQKWDAEIRVMEKNVLEVSGKKAEAWLVRAAFRSMEVSMWVDREGRLLKGRLPLDITVVRSDKDEILNQLHGVRDLPDIVALASVPVQGSMPDPAGLNLLKMSIQADRELSLPTDNFRQQSSGSLLTLTREQIPHATYSLPSEDPGMRDNLLSSRFIRSDHPEVIRKAEEIVGQEKDPLKAAALINRWVYKHLKKVPTPSVPDAYTILQTLEGDCNEHAVLAVSLARAVGLPARIALGLVYMNDGFYYHAWVTYWAGKRWISGDPLMNQLPADPSHITLLYGDVDKHMNVLTFLGKLKIEILEAH